MPSAESRRGGPRLVEARAALERGDWQEALDLVAQSAPDTGSVGALELEAMAAYGNGELERAVTAWEGLHSLLLERGDEPGAARAAAMVALYLMIDTGLMAPVRGWLRRAELLVGDRADDSALAVVAMVRTYERFMCGDMDAAREHAARAIELGGRLDVPSAVVVGRVAAARVTIFDGRVDDGLGQLDDVAALLMSGAVDPLTTGMMYCELICAAQGLALHERAVEWTDLMERWRHGAAFGGLNGRCRVHRAELLRVAGPCDAAEREALGACDELRPWMRREFGWPLAELGNIRLRKGDLEGAEAAFLAAHEHAWSPHPGLALVRLARGDVDAAVKLIDDAIAHPLDIPSKERPPFGDLRLAPLYEAQSEIAAAAGDVQAAQRAAEALASIAGRYVSPWLHASAALAAARAALATGDLGRAIVEAQAALVAWTDIGAPFEAANARLVLGSAHQRAGNLDGARLEWQAALAGFTAFGATGCAAATAELLDPATDVSDGAPAGGSTGTFTRGGDLRTVRFGGLTVSMRDLKGFRYLERMLVAPGREFHVLDLVAGEHRGGSAPVVPADRDELLATGPERGLPVLDDVARAAYQRRLAEVDDDIEEAESTNDIARLELAHRDREFLIAELTRAVGLGGRNRSTGGSVERARTSVARAVRYSLQRLAEHHPAVAAHFERTVRTGAYCAYEPDPLVPIVWQC